LNQHYTLICHALNLPQGSFEKDGHLAIIFSFQKPSTKRANYSTARRISKRGKVKYCFLFPVLSILVCVPSHFFQCMFYSVCCLGTPSYLDDWGNHLDMSLPYLDYSVPVHICAEPRWLCAYVSRNVLHP